MAKVLSYLTKLGFRSFILLFTALATVLAEVFVLPLNYWLTGSFFDFHLLIAAFIIPIIVGSLIFYFIAYLIRYLVMVQENLKEAETKLQNTNDRLKEAQNIAHLGFWEFDLQEERLYWSDEVYRIFGLEPQEFEATFEGFLRYVHPDDREELANRYRRSIEERTDYSIVHRIIQKNGAVRYAEEHCEHSYNSEGKPVKSIGTVYDITDHVVDQEKLQRLFDLQRNIIIQTDGIRLKKANQSFLNFFGYASLDDFLKKHDCICDLFIADERFFHLGKVPGRENWVEALNTLPKKERVVSIADNRLYSHAFTVSINHFDDDDYIVAFTDISETIQQQFSLEERVSRDHLTGAYSRDFFDANIRELMENAEKKNISLGLVMLDIDYFKRVNDTFGHDVGDRVLKHLVATIRYSIRSDDLLVRWGGEEFLLVIETESVESLRRMAEHVRQRVEHEIFEVVGRVTCSFGITLYAPNEPIAQTIKRSDSALYEAKAGGRNKVAQADTV
ncbi:diguanylate cyclase [bacterium]|nr:diguanylate cyclase [bacterium]